MKLLLIAILGLWLQSAAAGEQPSVVGHWFYYAKVYRGIEMPEHPEATLRLHFTFDAKGESRLYWWHEGDGDYCERRGKYRLEGAEIVDEVIWVNPQNTRDCALDPDMQPGRVTRTTFDLRGEDLVFHLRLGDEPLLYIWKKIEETR